MLRGTTATLRIPALALALLGIALQSPDAEAQQPRQKIEVVPQIAHANAVTSAAFTGDGARVLTASRDGTLKLWDIATTRLVRTFVGHKRGVTAVALSPDGRLALSGGMDKTVRLWEVATGRLVRTIYGHLDSGGGVSSVAFSPDGRLLLSASAGEGVAKLWDAQSGRLVRLLRHSKGSFRAAVTSAVFSADGTRIATGGAGDTIVSVWDAKTGQLIRAFGEPPKSTFSYDVKLALSPDGALILVGDDRSITLWDTAKGARLHTLERDDKPKEGLIRGLGPSFLAFSGVGELALAATSKKGLQSWSLRTGKPASAFHPKSTTFVAISPDRMRLLSAGLDGIKIWTVGNDKPTHTLKGLSSFVKSVAASPPGDRLLTVGRKVSLWDAENGRLLRSFKGRGVGPDSVVFSPDGTRLLASGHKALQVWDVASGRLAREIKAPPVHKVAFSADGTGLLALVADPPSPKRDKSAKRQVAVVTWDAATGKPRRISDVESKVGLSPAAAFSPDSTRFLGEPDYDQPVKVWDVAKGQVLHSFGGRATNYAQSAAFSPDNNRVAMGHIDGALKLWDVASGRPIRTLWHSRSVNAVAFSRDGKRLLSGSGDTTVKLWDTATGNLIRTFEGHSAGVRSVAFLPDGKRVISGSDDTSARIWSIETGEQLAMLLTSKDEWLAITPEGFFDASPNGAKMLSVVRGLEVYGIDQFYQSLYRPDLVREKLAGDPEGKVRAAAARLDLARLVGSGRVPEVTITSHNAEAISPVDAVTVKAQLTDRGGGIGRAEWRINGITVGVVERPAPSAVGQPVTLAQKIALDPGENTVELVAYNGANLVASTPARVKIAWTTGTEPTVPPRLYMLAVGVNDYLDGALKLTYAVPDAKALGAAFAAAGKGHYESVAVTMVLDRDVTAARLDEVFADLAGKVRPRDVFVFFAAGHGITLNGRYYFIPQDLRYRNNQSVVQEAIGQKKLQAWFAQILAKKAVLMFDTCEAGTLTERRRVATTRGLEQKAALGRLIQATGRATLTASTGTQEAYEGYGGHGVFTFALLDAMGRGDLNSNGLIELAELIQHVDGLVPAITEKRWGARQYPQMDAYGSNFPLARQVASLAPAQDGVAVIPVKPTHVNTEPLQVFKAPGGDGAVVQKLAPFSLVTLVKNEQGWVLIAREGKSLGYVAQAKLHKLSEKN